MVEINQKKKQLKKINDNIKNYNNNMKISFIKAKRENKMNKSTDNIMKKNNDVYLKKNIYNNNINKYSI